MREWLVEIVLLLVSLPFWALGWLVGFVWACILWVAASIVEGYQAGKGAVNDHRREHSQTP